MSFDIELMAFKSQLANCEQYKQIRTYQLERIIELSNSPIDPLILKGMLKLLFETQKWETDFNNLKNNRKDNNTNA